MNANGTNQIRGRILGLLGVGLLFIVMVVITRGTAADPSATPTTLDFTAGTSVTLPTTTTTSAVTRPATRAPPYFDERGWKGLPPNDLTSRTGSALVLAGDRVLVWGGISRTAPYVRWDGASYLAGRWAPMADNPIIAGVGPVAVWTGRELFVYSGASAAWHPGDNAWRDLAAPTIGTADNGHPLAGVWTGDEVIVVGHRAHSRLASEGNLFVAGYDADLGCCETYPDPPFGLTYGDAFWTGGEMLLIGALLDPESTRKHGDGRAYFGSLDLVSGVWAVHEPPSLENSIPIASTWTGSTLFVIDATGSAARWSPSDGWAPIPRVPLPTGLDCTQRLASVDGRAMTLLCDEAAVWDEVAERWFAFASPESVAWHSNACELLPGVAGRLQAYVICTSYIVGNQFIRIDLSDVEATRYSEPVTLSQWELLPNPAITHPATTTLAWSGDELIYLPGYIDVEDFGGWRYDPATSIMHRIPTPPYRAQGGQVALWTGEELLVSSGPMMVWDPVTLAWRTTNEPPKFSLVPYGAWAAGEAIFYGSVWEPYNAGAAYDPVADTWRTIATGPATVAEGVQVMASSGDEVFMLGNWSGAEGSQSGAVYDPSTDTWRLLPPLPDGLDLEGAVGGFVDGQFVVVGIDGLPWQSDKDPLVVGFSYSPDSGEWRAIAPIRQSVTSPILLPGGMAAVVHVEELALHLPSGTRPDTASIAFYRPSTDTWRYVDGAPASRWGAPLISGDTFVAYLTDEGTVLLHDP